MYYLALNPVKNILNKNEAEVDYRRIRGEGHVKIKAEIGGGVREGLSWPSDQKPISGSASCSCRPGVAKKYKNIVGKLETIQK